MLKGGIVIQFSVEKKNHAKNYLCTIPPKFGHPFIVYMYPLFNLIQFNITYVPTFEQTINLKKQKVEYMHYFIKHEIVHVKQL